VIWNVSYLRRWQDTADLTLLDVDVAVIVLLERREKSLAPHPGFCHKPEICHELHELHEEIRNFYFVQFE
jgi:hypothetical protein